MTKPDVKQPNFPYAPVCFTCPHYRETDMGKACTRYAPRPLMTYAGTVQEKSKGMISWPEVDPIDCCGEHPLMPEYIEMLRELGVLKLGSSEDFGSVEAEEYEKWFDTRLRNFAQHGRTK